MEYIKGRFTTQALEVKPLGEHGRAFLVNGEGGRPLVVKAIASEGKWRRYLWASEFLKEKRVNTPLFLLPPHSLPEDSLFLIFEQYVPGNTLSSSKPNPRVLEMVIRSIRALHSIEGKQWGTPTKKMRRRGYFRRHLRKIEKWCQYDPRLWREIQRRKWIYKIVERLEREEKTFQLTHGDLHGKNILVTQKGVFLVDLVRSGFGCYVKDLARLDIWERRTWGTRDIFEMYTEGLEDRLLEEKLKLFYLGEFVKRRGIEWIREELWRLLEREELP